MNDLDLVRTLRADVPPPAPARLTAGRSRILAAAATRRRRYWRRTISQARKAATITAMSTTGRHSARGGLYPNLRGALGRSQAGSGSSLTVVPAASESGGSSTTASFDVRPEVTSTLLP